MERLTNKREADQQRRNYEKRLERGYPRNIPEERFLRLAAYEDTGLTPEDVLRISNLLRLVGEDFNCRLVFVAQALVKYAEYTKAENEGRLVVLPCKVGDTVFRLITPANGPAIIMEIQVKTLHQAAGLVGNFGKKRFLISHYATREEAEAALKEAGNG